MYLPYLNFVSKEHSASRTKSRAIPIVEAHQPVNGPDTGKNSGGRRIRIKKLPVFFIHKQFILVDICACNTFHDNSS